MDALIELRGLSKSYGKHQVLKDINLKVAEGEVIVLIGPSGCGKSTLLRCVNGLEEIQGGSVLFRNEDLTRRKTDWRIVRQQIGMVFQSYHLFPHMTVIENIMLGPIQVQKRPKDEVLKQAKSLLERVGLSDKTNAFPRQLSGGQQQRIAIVRALCMNPVLMLFDEVTAALDPEMVKEVLEVMQTLAKENMTMMIVTHEMSFAKAVADRVIFMDAGTICEVGDPKTFFQCPQTPRAQQFLNQFIS
ncbi:MAG: amino acid ABC transporter ATP-binding protein [Candidatus Cohnella colombiensis]|uniref:Amino acid ABC transporter ATP-binding protein n=1 Tax=Candidatus Cohnella colombiensis TaxID=3121368 RepID=A0AA95EXU6_9BACL|nr:MAG: amino acid ABC transporter ATP-binding protein [Cohnella sp.]